MTPTLKKGDRHLGGGWTKFLARETLMAVMNGNATVFTTEEYSESISWRLKLERATVSFLWIEDIGFTWWISSTKTSVRMGGSTHVHPQLGSCIDEFLQEVREHQ